MQIKQGCTSNTIAYPSIETSLVPGDCPLFTDLISAITNNELENKSGTEHLDKDSDNQVSPLINQDMFAPILLTPLLKPADPLPELPEVVQNNEALSAIASEAQIDVPGTLKDKMASSAKWMTTPQSSPVAPKSINDQQKDYAVSDSTTESKDSNYPLENQLLAARSIQTKEVKDASEALEEQNPQELKITDTNPAVEKTAISADSMFAFNNKSPTTEPLNRLNIDKKSLPKLNKISEINTKVDSVINYKPVMSFENNVSRESTKTAMLGDGFQTASQEVNASWEVHTEALGSLEKIPDKLTLHVNQAELGDITAKIEIIDKQSTVTFITENNETKQILQNNLMDLKERFTHADLQLTQTSIEQQFNQQQEKKQQGESPYAHPVVDSLKTTHKKMVKEDSDRSHLSVLDTYA